jgi:hypothetical protein
MNLKRLNKQEDKMNFNFDMRKAPEIVTKIVQEFKKSKIPSDDFATILLSLAEELGAPIIPSNPEEIDVDTQQRHNNSKILEYAYFEIDNTYMSQHKFLGC